MRFHNAKDTGVVLIFGTMGDNTQKNLTDQFGRVHDYLRISLTDKCNLRCMYCMPNEHYDWMPTKHLLQADEILEIAKIFVGYGVRRIRLTGGEPLIRKEFSEIIEALSELPVSLDITTNGIFIDKHIYALKKANVRSINLSLDTLQAEKFERMTNRPQFEKVWSNLNLLLEEGIRVKLNIVAMRDENFDEILDFIKLTIDKPLHVRFIEFMPFDGNSWVLDKVLTYEEILDVVRTEHKIEKLADKPNATTKSYRVDGAQGTFAVISTVTEPFCSSCNRLRITADGKMRNCLFSTSETDLLTALRAGEDIRPMIEKNVLAKHFKLGGLPEFEDHERLMEKLDGRSMIKIGG
jgi:cyclic pyranopterin phosphate synthase